MRTSIDTLKQVISEVFKSNNMNRSQYFFLVSVILFALFVFVVENEPKSDIGNWLVVSIRYAMGFLTAWAFFASLANYIIDRINK